MIMKSRIASVLSLFLLSSCLPNTALSAEFHIAPGDVTTFLAAINESNANDEADTIHLAAGLYRITENDLESYNHFAEILSPIKIVGDGYSETTVHRESEYFFRFFYVHPSADLTLRGLTLTGGYAADQCGAAILVLPQGKLQIQYSQDSDTYRRFGGGAICSLGGTIAIESSVFISNEARHGGGAIESTTGSWDEEIFLSRLGISNSTFRNNQANDGGAIRNYKGELTLSRSRFAGNIASGSGGAIDIDGNESDVSISKSNFENNASTQFSGGAIELHHGSMEMKQSTLQNNRADRDGGSFRNVFGMASISNSTFSGNNAGRNGGAIVNVLDFDSRPLGKIELNNVTIALNIADQDRNGDGSGGGIYSAEFATTLVGNSILSDNRAGESASECRGTLTSRGHNLIHNPTDNCKVVGDMTGMISGENPMLQPLQNNGGLTDTHALAENSPAIDAGNPGTPGSDEFTCEIEGQRGVPRNCDIGAFELGVLPPNPDFQINSGLNDAWYNPDTSGQGLLITVFPLVRQMFMAWFTFDLEPPDDQVTSILGEPGHRWFTAQGEYSDNQAHLGLWVSSGGVFDSGYPETRTVQDGNVIFEFSSCNRGTMTYRIESVGVDGIIPLERIALDNVPLCEILREKQPSVR